MQCRSIGVRTILSAAYNQFDPSTTTRRFTTSPEWLRLTKSMLREFHKRYSVDKLYPILNGVETEGIVSRTERVDDIALKQSYKLLREHK